MSKILKKIRIIGLDLSLNGAGLAVIADGKVHARCWTSRYKSYVENPDLFVHMKLVPGVTRSNHVGRLLIVSNWIQSQVEDAISSGDDVYVAIEGYAFGAHSRSVTGLAELHGCVYTMLYRKGIPFRLYPPTLLKSAWVDGKACKGKMILACRELTGLDYTMLVGGDNLADAVLVAKTLEQELILREGNAPPTHLKCTISLTKKQKKGLPYVQRKFIRMENESIKCVNNE